MKASELRIGNLINGMYYDYNIDDDHREEETVCKVVTLDSVGSCEYPIWVESDLNIETFSDFEPIPLTEEWLLKFGFEKTYIGHDEKYPFFEKGLIIIDACDFTIETASGLVIEIKYVHSLQNLYFALTGEELKQK